MYSFFFASIPGQVKDGLQLRFISLCDPLGNEPQYVPGGPPPTTGDPKGHQNTQTPPHPPHRLLLLPWGFYVTVIMLITGPCFPGPGGSLGCPRGLPWEPGEASWWPF